MVEEGRDLVWDAIMTVAERLDRRCDDTLQVAGHRQWSRGGLRVTEGLWCGDLWTDVFEPVRRRWFLGGRWHEVQPVATAASNIGRFLRERPDLP